MIRVVVVDDEELVRSGLRLVLGTAPDIEVVAVCCGGGAAVATVLAHRPDVLLLDIRMPDVDGLTVLRRLHADPDAEAPRTAMLTTFDAEEYLGAALHAGAAGFPPQGHRTRAVGARRPGGCWRTAAGCSPRA